MGQERESAPEGLRRVLQDVVDGYEEDALDKLSSWLDKPIPAGLWGRDLIEWMRWQLERLTDSEVYDLLETALDGSWSYDERVNSILRDAEIGLTMVDGRFEEDDQAAEEFGVQDAADRSMPLLTGKYVGAKTMWAQSLAAQKAGDDKLAVALAVNTLEGVVKIASSQKDINRGLQHLFPEGERSALRSAINQLHNYASAMPWVRHGGGAKDLELERIEARGVIRAAAVWIVMVINLDSEGRFN
ncbi:hypothetical protein [Streptomyces lushanensis]|uniref:hypothetical protein n=1 Tax=Streptomyces lushanensis TaxID=1434255 RepID=UPI00082F365E|nr:hypothetical protein [Streptomyces lushanensis]